MTKKEIMYSMGLTAEQFENFLKNLSSVGIKAARAANVLRNMLIKYEETKTMPRKMKKRERKKLNLGI